MTDVSGNNWCALKPGPTATDGTPTTTILRYASTMTSAITANLGVTRCGNTTFVWGSRTYVMGILNLTHDSFSGDGVGTAVDAAVAQAVQMVAEGADILDLGGESSRPDSAPVDAAEELQRVLPALRAVRAAVSVPISIDTWKPAVAEAALDAGANLINDQWGLLREPALARLAAQRGVPIVLMHNLPGGATGRPNTEGYPDGLLPGIIARLRAGCQVALDAGVPWEQIIVDPGIGFAKGLEQNLETLRHLDELKVIGRPILLGTSRKGFIGRVLGLPVDQRVEGTAATIAIGIAKGAGMVRVHDVKAMARVARMADALVR